MPTGGVRLENVGEGIEAECVAGGGLTSGAKNGDFASITDLARWLIGRIRQARSKYR